MKVRCRYCSEEVVPGRTMCQRHLLSSREATQKYREKCLKEKRCTICGQRPLATKLYCEGCRVLYQKVYAPRPCKVCGVAGHTQNDHKTLGICWHCPKKALLGSNLCKEHHEVRAQRERARKRTYIENWRRQGKCLICGKKAVTQSRCQKHREYAAKWEHERRIR